LPSVAFCQLRWPNGEIFQFSPVDKLFKTGDLQALWDQTIKEDSTYQAIYKSVRLREREALERQGTKARRTRTLFGRTSCKTHTTQLLPATQEQRDLSNYSLQFLLAEAVAVSSEFT
jgi:hypothetical protein